MPMTENDINWLWGRMLYLVFDTFWNGVFVELFDVQQKFFGVQKIDNDFPVLRCKFYYCPVMLFQG